MEGSIPIYIIIIYIIYSFIQRLITHYFIIYLHNIIEISKKNNLNIIKEYITSNLFKFFFHLKKMKILLCFK